jgi:hypothetical protein
MKSGNDLARLARDAVEVLIFAAEGKPLVSEPLETEIRTK